MWLCNPKHAHTTYRPRVGDVPEMSARRISHACVERHATVTESCLHAGWYVARCVALLAVPEQQHVSPLLHAPRNAGPD